MNKYGYIYVNNNQQQNRVIKSFTLKKQSLYLD